MSGRDFIAARKELQRLTSRVVSLDKKRQGLVFGFCRDARTELVANCVTRTVKVISIFCSYMCDYLITELFEAFLCCFFEFSFKVVCI